MPLRMAHAKPPGPKVLGPKTGELFVFMTQPIVYGS